MDSHHFFLEILIFKMLKDTKEIDWLVLKVVNEKRRTPVFLVERTELSTLRTDANGEKSFKHELRLVCYGENHEVITVFGGMFSGHGDCQQDYVFHLTNGNMYISEKYRGIGIGTALQQLVVLWAKNFRQHGKVRQIFLAKGDAYDIEHRDRRNRFYEQFGYRFVWTPTEDGELDKMEGYSLEELNIEDIQPLPKLDKVEYVTLKDYVRETEYALMKLTLEVEIAEKNTVSSFNRYMESRTIIKRCFFILAVLVFVILLMLWFFLRWS